MPGESHFKTTGLWTQPVENLTSVVKNLLRALGSDGAGTYKALADVAPLQLNHRRRHRRAAACRSVALYPAVHAGRCITQHVDKDLSSLRSVRGKAGAA